ARLIVPIALVATLVFIFVPIGVSVIMSFDPRAYFGNFPPAGFSLRWYEFFFQYGPFISGLQLSILLGSLATVCSALVAIPTALAIVRYRFPGRELLSTLMNLPIIVPGVVTGVALLTFLVAFLRHFDSFSNLLIAH